jgi:hypothetical protein
LDQVLDAVRAGETATTLPAKISPGDLPKFANGVATAWEIPGCDPGVEVTELDDLTPCTLGASDAAHTMVLLGDSNAAMWGKALDLIGKRQGWRVILLGKDNCGPAALHYYIYPRKRDFTECDDWQKWRMEQVHSLKPDLVVLAGWYGGNLGPTRKLTPDVWRDGLIDTMNQLPEGTSVALLGNMPEIKVSPGECLAAHLDDVSKCAEPASEIVAAEGNDAIRSAADATKSLYVEITPWFCETTCPQVIGDHVAYAGIHHISQEYGMYLSGVLGQALQPAMASHG